MKESLINELNPANLTMDSKEAIEKLTVEELQELSTIYPAVNNFLELKNSESKVAFYGHYGSLIWHKKNFPNATFELVSVMPTQTSAPKILEVLPPLKIVPPKPLVDGGDANSGDGGEETGKEGTGTDKNATAEKTDTKATKPVDKAKTKPVK